MGRGDFAVGRERMRRSMRKAGDVGRRRGSTRRVEMARTMAVDREGGEEGRGEDGKAAGLHS